MFIIFVSINNGTIHNNDIAPDDGWVGKVMGSRWCRLSWWLMRTLKWGELTGNWLVCLTLHLSKHLYLWMSLYKLHYCTYIHHLHANPKKSLTVQGNLVVQPLECCKHTRLGFNSVHKTCVWGIFLYGVAPLWYLPGDQYCEGYFLNIWNISFCVLQSY